MQEDSLLSRAFCFCLRTQDYTEKKIQNVYKYERFVFLKYSKLSLDKFLLYTFFTLYNFVIGCVIRCRISNFFYCLVLLSTVLWCFVLFLLYSATLNLVPAGAPQNFTAVGLTETSVRLEWDLPAKHLQNGEIIMYQLMFHKLADQINSDDLNLTALQHDLTGLEMNTDYVFQIKAFTSKGSGPWSQRLLFHTFGRSRF